MSKARNFRRKQKPITLVPPPTAAIPVAAELVAPRESLRKRFAFIMSCMGRLDHAKQSVAALLESQLIDGVNNFLVFVDYYCPQHSGRWVSNTYGNRVSVLPMEALAPIPPGEPPVAFSKPAALNHGALHAISLGANYLVFIDADTLVTPGLIEYLFHFVTLGHFYIFEPAVEGPNRDLTGFLAVHKRHFIRVNGYDVNFKGWGAEDLDLRVRLYLHGATSLYSPRGALSDPNLNTLRWGEIPSLLASAIPHDDTRRVAHYEHKDKDLSHDINFKLLCSNIFNKLGVHPTDLHETPLGPAIRRLLGMELFQTNRD